MLTYLSSDAASWWAGWALAHPEFGVSVNPIPTRGADYAYRITACPLGFENLEASLFSDLKPNVAHSLKTYFLGLLTKVNFSNWNLENFIIHPTNTTF